MDQANVIAVFNTAGTGKDARIERLLLLKVSNSGSEIGRIELLPASAFGELVECVGGNAVVVQDGYEWKSLLRRELAAQPADDVKRFLDGVQFDMSQRMDQRCASCNGDHGTLFQRFV